MSILRITSAANPKLKYAIRLRESRFRRREQRFLADGPREIGRALDAGYQLERLFFRNTLPFALLPHDALVGALIDLLGAAETGPAPIPASSWPEQLEGALVSVSAELLGKLSYGERGPELVAQFLHPSHHLDDLTLPAAPLLVVLDRIEKPGNMGAILRTADAAGVDGVLVTGGPGDLYHPNVIRASCGAVFALPLALAAADDARRWLGRHQIRCLATRVDASQDLWQCDWRGGLALVIGNEAEGLGESWREANIEAVQIPMAGRVDSLNASVAAAICLFEAVRQRRSV